MKLWYILFLQKERQIGEGRERELKFLCCLFVFDIQSLSMVTFCNVEREYKFIKISVDSVVDIFSWLCHRQWKKVGKKKFGRTLVTANFK
jgi:hypothetical protein